MVALLSTAIGNSGQAQGPAPTTGFGLRPAPVAIIVMTPPGSGEIQLRERLQKNNAILIAVVIVGIMAAGSLGRDVRDYLPASWGPNDDLRSDIQDALDHEFLIEFTGSGDDANPLIYPSTTGLVIREETIVYIESDAQLKRLPSASTFLTLEDGAVLMCPGLQKGRIDGNKWAHWPAYPDLGKIWSITVKMGSDCYVGKIHVFSSAGHAFETYGDDNFVDNCKAEDVGYIDVKYNVYLYEGSLADRSSGDGFYFRGVNNWGQDLEGIDCQRWDFCASHTGSRDNTFSDCVGSDINFDGFGLYDNELSDGNNSAIRLTATSTNNPESDVMSNIGCTGHLTDCNLGQGYFYYFWDIDGNTLDGGIARELKIGRYGSSGTLTISGEVNLSEDISIYGADILTLHQTEGTITVGRDIFDSPHTPVTNPDPCRYYIITQTGGLLDVGDDVLIGNTTGSIGTHNLDGGSLKMSGTSSDPLLVYGYNGQGTLNIGNGSAVTEAASAGVPMVVRWSASASGTLQGYGTIGLTGYLVNNGKIIADGDSVERVLDLTGFSSVNDNFGANEPQNVENTTDNGWYAINKAELTLPAISVSAGNTTVNWGERPSDTNIDLVNSASVQFSNATAGQLSASLLATDRSDTQGGMFISVWKAGFTGNFDSAVLTFRYDSNTASELGISENDLKVYHRAEGSFVWENVTNSINLTSKHIVTDAVSSFSRFAIGVTPVNCGDPGTVYLDADWSGSQGAPDCYVNFLDFATLPGGDLVALEILASEWLMCTDPAETRCDSFWK